MVVFTVKNVSYTSSVLDRWKVKNYWHLLGKTSFLIICLLDISIWRSDMNLKFNVSKIEHIILPHPYLYSFSFLCTMNEAQSCLSQKPNIFNFSLTHHPLASHQGSSSYFQSSSRIYLCSLLHWTLAQASIISAWISHSDSYPNDPAPSLPAPSRKSVLFKE